MKFLQLVCFERETTDEENATMGREIFPWVDDTVSRGINITGKPLDDPASARTVRVRDGETLISDGPFADTKEFIAGFDIIDAENLDEAIAIAAKHPVSWYSAIELRPFMPGLEVPEQWAYADLRYLLMMFDGGGGDAPEVEAEVLATRDDWRATAAAKLVVAHGLEHRDNATTVRVRDGQLLLTDGPFAETKEFLAGIAVLNTDSEQEAIELAAEFPLARFHMVEVRPFWGG
jgi:hypothetical protein